MMSVHAKNKFLVIILSVFILDALLGAAEPGVQGMPPKPRNAGHRTLSGLVVVVDDRSLTIRHVSSSLSGSSARTVRYRAGTLEIGYPLDIDEHDLDGNLLRTVLGTSSLSFDGGVMIAKLDGTVITIRCPLNVDHTYRATWYLRDPKYVRSQPDARAYGLWDVRPGDLVTLDLVREDKTDPDGWWCCDIQITARPGGRVPPSNNPDPKKPHHEWLNAQRDWVEKGIPLPERFETNVFENFPELQARLDEAERIRIRNLLERGTIMDAVIGATVRYTIQEIRNWIHNTAVELKRAGGQ